MRLLYLADFPLPMPYARSIQTLQTCAALARQGCDVTLLAGRNGHGDAAQWLDWYGLAPHPRLTIQQVPVITRRAQPHHPRYGSYDAQALWAVGQAIRRRAIDCLYVRTPRLLRLLALTGYTGRIPVVAEVHRVQGLTPAYGRRVYRRVRGLVTLTDGAQEIVRSVSHGVPVVTARDGAVVRATDSAAPAMIRRIAFVGHFHVVEGVELLLAAMPYVPMAALHLVGGINDAHGRRRAQHLRQCSVQLGVADRVMFEDAVSPAEVPQRLVHADAVVLPYPEHPATRACMSPLKLFEAMAAGKPIVATDLPALREVLRDGENAVLVAPDDPQALADGIRRVFDDPMFARRIAQQAQRDAARYTWDRRAEQLMTFLRQVVVAP